MSACDGPAPGDLVIDTPTGREAVVMDVLEGRLWLRPVGGGVETARRPDQVQAAADPAAEVAR